VNLKETPESANLIPDQKIDSIKTNQNVSIVGRLVEIETKRSYSRKDGTQGNFFTFTIQDISGMIRCVVWDQNINILSEPGFSKNEVVRIVNGLVKSGRTGGNEIHVGSKSRIQLNPDNVDYKLIPSSKDEKIIFTKINQINIL